MLRDGGLTGLPGQYHNTGSQNQRGISQFSRVGVVHPCRKHLNTGATSTCIYEMGQPRWWHSLCLSMPRSILRIWMLFFDTAVLTMHRPTNGTPAPLFLLFLFWSEEMWPIKHSEKYKSDRNLSAKKRKKKKKGSLPIRVHMRFKQEAIYSDRNSQNIERGIAVCHLFSSLLV